MKQRSDGGGVISQVYAMWNGGAVVGGGGG